jgi:hypothetical protein
MLSQQQTEMERKNAMNEPAFLCKVLAGWTAYSRRFELGSTSGAASRTMDGQEILVRNLWNGLL